MRQKIARVADKIVEYSLYGLIFCIPISSSAIEIFAGLAILGFVVKKILLRKSPFHEQPLLTTNLFLLLFIVFSGLALLNSGLYLKKSLEALFFKWIEYILIFLIVKDTLNSPRRLNKAVMILLMVGGIVGIDGLFQHFLGWEFLRQRPVIEIREVIRAITGPFKHHNDFAAYLVCVLPLALALFLAGVKEKIYRIGLFFVVVSLGLCLLFSFSRGGWLGFLAAGLLMLVLSRKAKVIVIIVCSFMLMLVFLPLTRGRVILTFLTGTGASRFDIWQGAWEIIRENPFLGKGIGTFMQYFPLHTHELGVQYAHNCYLQMWTEIGVFGLLSFLLFAGSILYQGIKTFREKAGVGIFGDISFRDKHSFSRQRSLAMMLGFTCAIFGFLVHSFFDTQFYSLQLSVLFWVFLGMVSSQTQLLRATE